MHQFLTASGAFPGKRAVYDAIRRGQVTVDDTVTTNPLYRLRPGRRLVCWKGEPLEYAPEKTYLLLNKPEGVLCSRLSGRDRLLGKKSVYGLLAEAGVDEKTLNSLFCVGRLDEDTCGLLILSSDGRLCHQITNPRHGITKTYHAVLDKPLDDETVRRIEAGVTITLEEDGRATSYHTRGCSIRMDGRSRDKVFITLSEGRKREVRRIFEAVGWRVLALKRTAVGGLCLSDLKLRKGGLKQSAREYIQEKVGLG